MRLPWMLGQPVTCGHCGLAEGAPWDSTRSSWLAASVHSVAPTPLTPEPGVLHRKLATSPCPFPSAGRGGAAATSPGARVPSGRGAAAVLLQTQVLKPPYKLLQFQPTKKDEDTFSSFSFFLRCYCELCWVHLQLSSDRRPYNESCLLFASRCLGLCPPRSSPLLSSPCLPRPFFRGPCGPPGRSGTWDGTAQ